LPTETVNYVASIAPLLGAETPMSGPLAVYAGGATVTRVAFRPMPSGCDPDAAYNPGGPCTPLRSAVVAAAASPVTADQPCDPDAAYDPTRPCRPPAPAAVAAQPIAPAVSWPPMRYATESRPIQERMSQPVAFSFGPAPGKWMIQVGAFATLSIAQGAAEHARSVAPDLLRMTDIELPATAPLGTQVAFRARLSGLSASAAAEACSRLTGRGIACITVPPPRDSF
jgi:hypothetical protein